MRAIAEKMKRLAQGRNRSGWPEQGNAFLNTWLLLITERGGHLVFPQFVSLLPSSSPLSRRMKYLKRCRDGLPSVRVIAIGAIVFPS